MTTDATCCAHCGGPFSNRRVHIDGAAYHRRCSYISSPPHTEESMRWMNGEIGRLRATLLNIQSLAETGYQINHAKLAAQCRHALEPVNQQKADASDHG